MVWVRIDDQLHAHPKIRAAWDMEPAAVGLELIALSHSAAYLTDGAVDKPFVRQWLPVGKQRRRTIGALVKAGLWVPNGRGWQIHDWLDYNESRAAVLERRRAQEEARKRKRKELNDGRGWS
jgi:hypothetical protein